MLADSDVGDVAVVESFISTKSLITHAYHVRTPYLLDTCADMQQDS